MKAVRLYGVGDLRVNTLDLPEMAANQLRLKVLAAGICGSDLHNYRTGKWLAQLPVTPGHEICGEVLEVGADVRGFQPGDRVVADSRVWCGECPACQRRSFNLCTALGFVGEVCDGGFAEQTVLPPEGLLKVPADMPAAVAVLSEPLGVALRVVNQLRIPAGARVRVAGGGTIGGLVALLLHEVAQCQVQLSEPNVARYQLLAQIIPLQPDGEFDYAVEATGITAVLQQLVDEISAGGRIALVGLFHHRADFDFNRLVEREIDLVGCSVFADEQRQALALLPQLADKLATLTAPPIALDAVPQTYLDLIAGNSRWLKSWVQP
ncbi:(R,R)-butanediol dehydrogenase/meso-butanediol dehydrogenase/diacetyl reductase [Erwinia toletana]|uniref:(R,R)-butanediol dehydrogenase/meso-butanediol dehydrogenase/diacetyl reductase n=1 Tax=Winslowiella toletana TaxID=92490 RepID=A0ABS4PCY0_9GAMM|nr:alcohol dehydrogenase catalytic domain-containing protein [Winslowiella toletana]MBP2170498.1 (R,R)-butanediol dehydrogenase/meso-butanediol dehydrogenase/diacetyl reductase [Winslowiella toletana]